MEKLNKLIKSCKAGVHLTINGHKDYYESVEYHFSDRVEDEWKGIDSSIMEKMIEMDTIIELQFYPDTPVGFYSVFHYDLESAIDTALNILKEE